ncbi:hypothetical protein RUM43_008475 [Polyplax serrata]|uniref:SelT-like protein n=1 Tax=Polyplax serrata TaxID=468196 RepID=A0AAN8P9E5_POLSC
MADLIKSVPVILFGFFLLFTIKDLFVSHWNAEASNKDIPVTNLGSSKFMGPTLKILYCYSCGYRNAYEQYADMLNKKYPDLIVEGGIYPPPTYNSILAKILNIGKMFIILAIILDADISQYLGMMASSWYWCRSNKIYSCALIYFMCNFIEGNLISTGAFEISFNDVPVWSKIETGRIPQPPELFQIIERQMQFTEKTFEIKPDLNFYE